MSGGFSHCSIFIKAKANLNISETHSFIHSSSQSITVCHLNLPSRRSECWNSYALNTLTFYFHLNSNLNYSFLLIWSVHTYIIRDRIGYAEGLNLSSTPSEPKAKPLFLSSPKNLTLYRLPGMSLALSLNLKTFPPSYAYIHIHTSHLSSLQRK